MKCEGYFGVLGVDLLRMITHCHSIMARRIIDKRGAGKDFWVSSGASVFPVPVTRSEVSVPLAIQTLTSTPNYNEYPYKNNKQYYKNPTPPFHY